MLCLHKSQGIVLVAKVQFYWFIVSCSWFYNNWLCNFLKFWQFLGSLYIYSKFYKACLFYLHEYMHTCLYIQLSRNVGQVHSQQITLNFTFFLWHSNFTSKLENIVNNYWICSVFIILIYIFSNNCIVLIFIGKILQLHWKFWFNYFSFFIILLF